MDQFSKLLTQPEIDDQAMKPFITTVILMIQLEMFATVTINLDAERLKTASGAPMPTSGLVILVARDHRHDL